MTSTTDTPFPVRDRKFRRRSQQLNGVLRFLRNSGVLSHASFRGFTTALRELRKGRGGPPLIYRVNAANVPQKEAVVCGQRRLSYAELDENSDRLAGALHERMGICSGDAVLVMTPNCSEVLELQAAVMRLGASLVYVSWRSTVRELEFLLRDSGAKAIATSIATTNGDGGGARHARAQRWVHTLP